jgi:DNA-binding SARP family transcriptional activator
MLTITLFGTPEIIRDGVPVAISRRKSRALLYYLADNIRPLQREHLLNWFWPDTERVAAQQVLRTTLHGLRKELGESLVVERDNVSLEPSTRVDARMFERNLASPSTDVLKLETILELYRGPFLDDFHPGENVEFEQWMLAERERYQRMAVRGMVSLSRLHAAVGDYAAALRALERGLALDPLQEDLQRETIRLAYLSGDRAGAIRRYDQLRRLLDEELGVPPMAETRGLYDQILNDSLPVPPPAAAPRPVLTAKTVVGRQESDFSLPFRSREAELRLLQTELFTGRLLLVEGEPGVGKTRLVEHFLSGLNDVICLRGAGRELESNLPYQPVVEALRSLRAQPQGDEWIDRVRHGLPDVWLGEAARLMPELAQGSSATAEEWRLWEGVHQFLRALSAQRPVVVFVDDLQWADSSSLGLLGYLIRNLTPNGAIGLVAASHPPVSGSPLSGLITALGRADRVVRIPLRRFNLQEVTGVVAGLVGPAEALAHWFYEHSEGNLYVLAEFVRQARQNGWLDGRSAPPPEAAPDVSRALHGLIQSRLSRLTDAGRRILDTAVAVGRDFDFDLVARASGLSEDAALDGLDELLAAGLVHATGPTTVYRFDHSLVMEVAYREVGEARHRQSHRHIAAAMKQVYRQNPPKNLDGLLAFHYTEGNEPERAAPHAFQVGMTAVGLAAWQQAAVFFEQALQGTEGPARYPILMQLGLARARGGAYAQALETFQQALDLALAAGARAEIDAARLQLAQAYIPLARFEDLITQTRSVLEQGLPENAMFAELWWGTALSLEGADLQGAGEHLDRAAQASRLSGRREPLAQVEFELGTLWAQRGDLPQAVAHYFEALRVAEEADSLPLIERRTLAHNNLAYHLLLMNDPRAEEHARLGMELAREKGLLGLQPYLYSTTGEIALSKEDWDSAQEQFTRGLDLAQRLGIPERIAGLRANLGLVARARGQADKAVEWLTSARAMADELGLRHLAAQIRIWIAPLLPRADGRAQLDEARAIAQHGGRMRLLEEEERVRKQMR